MINNYKTEVSQSSAYPTIREISNKTSHDKIFSGF